MPTDPLQSIATAEFLLPESPMVVGDQGWLVLSGSWSPGFFGGLFGDTQPSADDLNDWGDAIWRELVKIYTAQLDLLSKANVNGLVLPDDAIALTKFNWGFLSGQPWKSVWDPFTQQARTFIPWTVHTNAFPWVVALVAVTILGGLGLAYGISVELVEGFRTFSVAGGDLGDNNDQVTTALAIGVPLLGLGFLVYAATRAKG